MWALTSAQLGCSATCSAGLTRSIPTWNKWSFVFPEGHGKGSVDVFCMLSRWKQEVAKQQVIASVEEYVGAMSARAAAAVRLPGPGSAYALTMTNT